MSDDQQNLEQWIAEYKTPNESAWINNLAIRCFRDVGDGDYIAARLALRARLPSQFLWAASQALEKYLKCMLLLGRVGSKTVVHDIAKALEMVNERLHFNINLPDNEREVFQHIVDSQGDRYLVISITVFDHEISAFDALVWRLRQYCTPLDIEHYNDSPSNTVLLKSLARIESGLTGGACGGHLEQGFLEKILAKDDHAAREGLVWRNAMFGGNEPIVACYGLSNFMAINSPLYLNPQIARPVSEWIYLPKGAVEAFETLAATRIS